MCSTSLLFFGLNPIFGAPLPAQIWLGKSSSTFWNAIAGGALVGALALTPTHELTRDNEQEE